MIASLNVFLAFFQKIVKRLEVNGQRGIKPSNPHVGHPRVALHCYISFLYPYYTFDCTIKIAAAIWTHLWVCRMNGEINVSIRH